MTTLTEVLPCFFLSCKANARVKPAKTGHGPHSSQINCVVLCIVCFVSFYVFLCCSIYCLFCVVLCTVCVYMCTVLLPPGGYPIAVKCIISCHISYIIYRILSYRIISFGFTPGGSSTVHIYTQTIHGTTQLIWEECGPCPVIASYTLAFALQPREKHGKTSVRLAIHKHTSTMRIHSHNNKNT